MNRMYVYCTTRFVALHRWDNAPDSVAFLRNEHRHVFHVKVACPVSHAERDIEFITLKAVVDAAIKDMLANWTGTASCEQICDGIKNRVSKKYLVASVEVSEDGENGAVVLYE